MCGSDEPIHTAKIEPAKYWPWPPMLNMPQRNANATARAVRMIGVVSSSVCWRFCAATDPVFHQKNTFVDVNGMWIEYEPKWKNQFRPVPLKIAL